MQLPLSTNSTATHSGRRQPTNVAGPRAHKDIPLTSSTFRLVHRWLVLTLHHTKRDRNPVPSIDRDHSHRQVHQLLLRKVLPRMLIHRIRNMVRTHQSHSLAPRQRSLLAIRKERRLPPGVQSIEPLFALALRTSIFRVHIQTIRTPINLRRPHLHQFQLQAEGYTSTQVGSGTYVTLGLPDRSMNQPATNNSSQPFDGWRFPARRVAWLLNGTTPTDGFSRRPLRGHGRINRARHLPHSSSNGKIAGLSTLASSGMVRHGPHHPMRSPLLLRASHQLPLHRRRVRLPPPGLRHPPRIPLRLDVRRSHGPRPCSRPRRRRNPIRPFTLRAPTAHANHHPRANPHRPR